MATTSNSLRAVQCSAKPFGSKLKTCSRVFGLKQQRQSVLRAPLTPSRTQEAKTVFERMTPVNATQLYEVADMGSFIGGTAATMFAMTLIGLALGFVLLRVDALIEEGKI